MTAAISKGMNPAQQAVEDRQWPVFDRAVVDATALSVCLGINLKEHHFWFEGHFPEHPVLPGIVQLNWAGEVSRRLFAPSLRFTNLQSVKFQNTIGPAATVELDISWCSDRQRALFRYRGDDTAYSSGRIHFR